MNTCTVVPSQFVPEEPGHPTRRVCPKPCGRVQIFDYVEFWGLR